jgi:hypothetical protein
MQTVLNHLVCHQPLLHRDVVEKRKYVSPTGEDYIYIKFRCSHCKKLGELFVKKDEWQESLLSDE